MKILFFNQFFYPDSAASSQYLTDVTYALQPVDSADVICGSANYAANTTTTDGVPPVKAIHIHNRPFGRGLPRRISSYLTFLIGAGRYALRTPRPDVVVTLTTPPFMGIMGTLLKRLRGSRHVVWEMDVYPDIAIGLRLLSPLTGLLRITAALANMIHRHADAIIVLGECMKIRLISHGIPAHKIHIAENWADGSEIVPSPFPTHSKLILYYSGNFGLAHDLSTIQSAILQLRSEPEFKFVFAGGGRHRDDLQKFCIEQQLTSVQFKPYCRRSELGGNLAQGHVGLVTLNPAGLGSVVPSKAYGIMAAGRPVLFIGPRACETARMIERFECGWQIDPGDAAALIVLLRRLSADPTAVERAGARARVAFEAHYDLPVGVARVARIIGMSGNLSISPQSEKCI